MDQQEVDFHKTLEELTAAQLDAASFAIRKSKSSYKLVLWALEASRRESHLNDLYRIRRRDIDSDLLAIVRQIRKVAKEGADVDIERMLSVARPVWRFLMGNYALIKAQQVNWQLCLHETPKLPRKDWVRVLRTWSWGAFRFVSICLPRVFIATVVGFGLFASASDLRWVSKPIAENAALFNFTVLSCLSLVCFLAFFEVHQRVGRRFITVVKRAFVVVLATYMYVALGIYVYHRYEVVLPPYEVSNTTRLVVMGSMVALLSFVFQVFWQDRSLGDPL